MIVREYPTVTDPMTSKPPVYGVISTWTIHDTDGKDYKLYQSGPALTTPLELIQFAWGVARHVNEVAERYDDKERPAILENSVIDTTDAFSRKRLPHTSGLRRMVGRLGPIAQEMYYRVTEFNISLEHFVNKRRPQPPKVAYVWEVWSVGRGNLPLFRFHPGCEIAFTANDKDGAPDPNFTFERTTPEDLIELLEARDLAKKTFKL